MSNSEMLAKQGAKMGSMGIRVFRVDGSIEDYGTVSLTHLNPLQHLYWKVKRYIWCLELSIDGIIIPVRRLKNFSLSHNPSSHDVYTPGDDKYSKILETNK